MSYKLRKIILLGLILILYIPVSNAQSQKSLAGFAGYTNDGIATLFGFSYSFNDIKYDFLEASVYSGYLKERKTEYNVEVNVHSINLGYFKRIEPLSTLNGLVCTYVGIGGLLGKESINNGNNELSNGALITSKGGAIYGGFGAVQADLFISNRFHLLGRYTHFYHANSEVGKSKFMIGLGLKYVIF